MADTGHTTLRVGRNPSRREWLAGCLGTLGAAMAPPGLTRSPALAPSPTPSQAPSQAQARRTIETVAGPIDPAALGLVLMHEHVLVDFIGAAEVSPSRYDADAVFTRVLPFVRQVKELGGATLVDCTPAYLGRDARLLRRLAEASGLNILSNTGYYGANNDKHLPPHAFTETAQQLAARWIREGKDGIDGTGIKPAFMKIGVDSGPLSSVDAKLVRAAAIAHQATGLCIAVHTGDGVAAREEMDILAGAGVPLSSFIWVHAHSEADGARHLQAAARGAWVEFDGIAPTSVERHVALVLAMRKAGRLDRVLVSHDAGWYRVGEPGGGAFRAFDTLFTAFVPALKAAGLTDADVRQLLVDNPRRALTPRG
ncbi:MAG: phosphotriesterase [Vicinamibacteraceae bacterium]